MAQLNQGHDEIAEAQQSNPELQVIWEKFDRLKRCRDEAYELVSGGTASSSSDWTPPHDDLQSKVIDPIEAQLFELAWAATELRANCQRDLRLKALMLEEYLIEDDDDLSAGLTRSLLRDVLDN